MRQNLLRRENPDGLPTTSIGRWALDKYSLVHLYAELFSTGMKDKWPMRIYVDLCSGSGFSEIDGAPDSVYRGSPLLALGVPNPFDKYVFCERDAESLAALRQRTTRLFPNASVRFVEGDCDERIGEIAAEIPAQQGVLSFCFADPFDLSIKFSSIRLLATRRVDFLFMLALHMDGNRNVAHYTNKANKKIDEFLGLTNWRALWNQQEPSGIAFPRFLAEQFSGCMEKIGYIAMPFHTMKQVRSDGNSPLYHLAFYSKHSQALHFWNEVLRYSDDQKCFDYD
jgi:three-Cys-motif partner protein